MAVAPRPAAAWDAMTPARQRAHAAADLRARIESFGAGPKWTFAADSSRTGTHCDLANGFQPRISSRVTAHPGHHPVRDHTGAGQAHLLVDPGNVASLRVARAVGAIHRGYSDEHEPPLARHILVIDRQF